MSNIKTLAREALAAAADELSYSGWCQNVPTASSDTSRSNRPARDANSAIEWAVDMMRLESQGFAYEVKRQARGYLYAHLNPGAKSVPAFALVDWNDDPDRSDEEVIDELRRAAKETE